LQQSFNSFASALKQLPKTLVGRRRKTQ